MRKKRVKDAIALTFAGMLIGAGLMSLGIKHLNKKAGVA